jgi:hypothetical protein
MQSLKPGEDPVAGRRGDRAIEEEPVKHELYRVARLVTRVASVLHLSPKFARQELKRLRTAIDNCDEYLKAKGYEG